MTMEGQSVSIYKPVLAIDQIDVSGTPSRVRTPNMRFIFQNILLIEPVLLSRSFVSSVPELGYSLGLRKGKEHGLNA